MNSKKEPSLGMIGFLQAVGVVIYCNLVAIIFWRENEWLGRIPKYIGPLLGLVLFSTSALILRMG